MLLEGTTPEAAEAEDEASVFLVTGGESVDWESAQ